MMFFLRKFVALNFGNDRNVGNRFLDIAAGISVRAHDNQTVKVVRVFRDSGNFKCFCIQHKPVPAVRHKDCRFVRNNCVDGLSGQWHFNTLQTAGKPCSLPANSSYYRCILVFVGVNFQFFLHLFKNIFGSIRFGIRYNIAKIARAVFFRGIYKMHVRVTESGYNTLSVTINNFCAVANPRFRAFVIADVYKFSILYGKCLRMSLRAVQCNGINFRIPVNFVCNF